MWPCKHKGAISKFKNYVDVSVLPESDSKKRALYHYIADGTVCTNSWYRDLNNPDDITNVEHFVETKTDNASHDIAATVSRHTDVPSMLDKDDGGHSEEDVSENKDEDDQDDQRRG